MGKKRFYSNENTIVTYNRDRKLRTIIQEAADSIKSDIFAARNITDLIAIPSFMSIVNPKSLAAKDMDEFFTFLNFLAEEESTKTAGILFLSKPSFLIASKYRKFIVKTPDNLDSESLRMVMLNRRSAACRRRNGNLKRDRKIFRLMKMIVMLKSGKVLRADELISEFGVTSKTVYRDIALLDTLGMSSEYDKEKKGYVMVYDCLSDFITH